MQTINEFLKYPYGKASMSRLVTVDEALQDIFIGVANICNTSILCGERKEKEQNDACNAVPPKSFAIYPESNHNVKLPDRPVAIAIDAGPYDIKIKNVPWPTGFYFGMTTRAMKEECKRVSAWYEFAGIVKAVAHKKGIPIRWGGNFKSIFDAPHWELCGAKYSNV